MKTTASLISFTSLAAAVSGLLLAGLNHSRAAAPAENDANDETTRPRFVFIEGQVNVPQRYVYTNGLTLGAGIKMARGVTAQASPIKVTLTRKGEQPMNLDRQAIEQGRARDIELQPGDRVFVPKK